MIRRALDAWERRCAAFCASPWASGVLAVYGVVWIGAEAVRGKWIGWDGVITLLALECALATYRRVKA